MPSRIWLAVLLIVGLFIMGGLCGAGVQWALKRPESGKAIDKSAQTAALPAPAATPAPPAPLVPQAPAVPAPEPTVPALSNMAQGPLKRACLGLWRKLLPFVARCDAGEKLGLNRAAKPAVLRVAFKAVGGVATALTVAVQSPEAKSPALEACLSPKLGPLVLDFPAEDGSYAFTSPLSAFDERAP